MGAPRRDVRSGDRDRVPVPRRELMELRRVLIVVDAVVQRRAGGDLAVVTKTDRDVGDPRLWDRDLNALDPVPHALDVVSPVLRRPGGEELDLDAFGVPWGP